MQRQTPLRRTAMRRKKARHAPTPADKEHWAWVLDQECVIGQRGWAHECRGHTTVSHFNGVKYKGVGQRSDHRLVLPVCVGHHLRGPHSIEGMGFHPWRDKYGSEAEMLAWLDEHWPPEHR